MGELIRLVYRIGLVDRIGIGIFYMKLIHGILNGTQYCGLNLGLGLVHRIGISKWDWYTEL